MKSCKSAMFAVFVLGLFAFPGYSFAHSALVSAVPHEFSESEVAELQLTFNEAIEPASRVEVANADGEEQAISETKVNGEVLTAVFETPLRDGVYTVNWRIISADGHPVRGSYSIQVQIPEELSTPSLEPEESDDPLPENSASPSTEPEQSSEPVPSESPADASEPEAPASESGKIDATTWILVAAAILLGYAIISAVLKKKKK